MIWLGGHRIDDGAMQIGALTAFLTYLMQILMAVMDGGLHVRDVPARRGVGGAPPGGARHGDSVPLPRRTRSRSCRAAATSSCAAPRSANPGAEPRCSRMSTSSHVRRDHGSIIGSTAAARRRSCTSSHGLFDATGGEVLVDGIDVRRIAPATLSRTVSLVPQRPYLFSGHGWRGNLRYGRTDATDEELWHALEIAQAASFVRELDGGLDAPIAQGGTNVSGGQRAAALDRALPSSRAPRCTCSMTRSRPSTTPRCALRAACATRRTARR